MLFAVDGQWSLMGYAAFAEVLAELRDNKLFSRSELID